VAKDRLRRTHWSQFLWDRETRRLAFYDRHEGLRPIPYLIQGALVVALSLSVTVAFSNPSAKLYGYAASLVVIDLGMVAIAALFVIAGRPMWQEDRDSTYLALAIGFAGIPVWGLLEILCLGGALATSIPMLCDARPITGWIAGLWFATVPGVSFLLGFRRFLLQARRSPGTL